VKAIIVYNGESCSWCRNTDETGECNQKRSDMEATRIAVKGLNECTKAYCSIKVRCDYYSKDLDKYYKLNPGCVNSIPHGHGGPINPSPTLGNNIGGPLNGLKSSVPCIDPNSDTPIQLQNNAILKELEPKLYANMGINLADMPAMTAMLKSQHPNFGNGKLNR